MKKYSLLIKLVICCGIGLLVSPAYAQRVLTAAQLDAIVRTDMDSCSPQKGPLKSGRTDPASIIPTSNAQEIPQERIARTLNGIWRGRVLGDDKDVGVDYYWITDSKRNEALVIAQRSGTETVSGPVQGATAPKFTFLMCAHEGYFPSKSTPQIHEFTKVSDNIDDAARIVQKSTGLKLHKAHPTLAELWKGLVAMGYFNDERYVAYAGGFFKSFQIQSVPSAIGPASIAINWNGEYRGGGSTSLKFTNGVPVYGVEHALFTGTRITGGGREAVSVDGTVASTASSGDYLVSSPGNGQLWKVEAVVGAEYELAFDKVVLGPLQ
jgi:hypothetical protein